MTAVNKTFTFEHEGKSYSIPSFKHLPIGAIRKVRKLEDQADQVFTLLETVLGVDSPTLAAVDTMDTEEFQLFFTEWTGGAPLGESSDS